MLRRLGHDKRSRLLTAVEVWPSLSAGERQEFYRSLDSLELFEEVLDHQGALIRSRASSSSSTRHTPAS